MTRKDLQCVHEPFGDAYYFGPERLGYRYEGPENEQARQESGYANSTFRSIFDRIAKDNAEVHDPDYFLAALLLGRTFSSLTLRSLLVVFARSDGLHPFVASLKADSIMCFLELVYGRTHANTVNRVNARSSKIWRSTGFLLAASPDPRTSVLRCRTIAAVWERTQMSCRL